MKDENKYKKLAKNTVVLSIGSFGSKILTFLVVPLYTHYLTTEEYGIIDLFTTAMSLMLPFTTLVIYESVIKFHLSKEVDRKTATSVCMVVFGFGSLVILMGIPLYKYLFGSAEFIPLFILYLLVSTYNQIFSHYLRAIEKTVAFSINGIIITAAMVLANVYCLVWKGIGILGYFYALIIAQAFACIQATIAGRVFSHISLQCVDRKILKLMLLYCVPMIPNSLMWWIMNAGDKYIINYFLGTGMNGVYALAMKIPTILNMIYSIFMQAWQISALTNIKSAEEGEFHSNIYLLSTALISLCSSGIIMIVKPIFTTLMGADFQTAWQYVPYLCIAMVFSCQATFLGTIYMTTNQSGKLFTTTAVGAVVNIFVSFLLVKLVGLYGVIIGTIISYMVIAIIRAYSAKKAISINLFIVKNCTAMVILLIQAVLLDLVDTNGILYVQVFCFLVLIALYFSEVKKLVSQIIRRIK